MRAVVLLADAGQVDGSTQKLHAIGLGWTVTSSPTPPAAVCVFIIVPWNATNQRHNFSLYLQDADGRPVQDPAGNAIKADGSFEMGRPAGVPVGSPLTQPFVLPIPPGLQLEGGQSYEWRMEIDGTHEEDWSVRFHVRGE
jgi:hypothetical protein